MSRLMSRCFPTLGTFDQVAQLGMLPMPTQTRITVILSPSTGGWALSGDIRGEGNNPSIFHFWLCQ